MNVTIQRLSAANLADFNRCDTAFTVEAELHVHAADGRITHSVHPVAPYIKRYEPEAPAVQAYLSRPDHAAWLAYVGSELAGQLLVHEHWNRFASLEGIAVQPPLRRRGVGSLLVAQASQWARARGLAGVTLETQNINVGACRFYERCGFELLGFDAALYRGVLPGTPEIALYWYLFF